MPAANGYVIVENDYLEVKGNANERAYIGGDGAGGDVQIGSLRSNVTTVAAWNAESATRMSFIANNVTAVGGLVVDTDLVVADASANRVGVYTSSPDYTFEVEHVTGIPGATSGNGLTIKNKSGGADNHWTFYNWSSGNLSLYKAGDLKGTFSAADGIYSPASDRRLKTNITPIEENILEKVKQLKPARYHFKDHAEGERQYGLIAQEVQQVFPELTPVIESVADGGEKDTLGMSYMELVPILVKAIQEQQTDLEALRRDNAEIVKRFEALEKIGNRR